MTDINERSMYFVWLSVNGKTVPQIWHDLPTDGNGKARSETLFKVKLSGEEEQLSLDELALKFKAKLNDH